MEEIRLGKAVAARNKRDLWNQLCSYTRLHRKNPGMAFHLYQDIAGEKPPCRFELATDVPVGRAIENEIKRRNIAFAKSLKGARV